MVAQTNDSSPGFEAILRHAVALCEVAGGSLYLLDEGRLRLVVHLPESNVALAEMKRTFPLAPHRGSVAGRAALDRVVINVADIENDREYTLSALARQVGFRSLLAIPMLRE